jgi:hypothetical protein
MSQMPSQTVLVPFSASGNLIYLLSFAAVFGED